jgi:hypothetical protein
VGWQEEEIIEFCRSLFLQRGLFSTCLLEQPFFIFERTKKQVRRLKKAAYFYIRYSKGLLVRYSQLRFFNDSSIKGNIYLWLLLSK